MTPKKIDLFGPRPEGEPIENAGAEPAAADPTAIGQPRVAPVPKNLLETDNPLLLRLAEDTAGSIRAWEANVGHVYLPGSYDAEHLCDIHAHVMQDIYPVLGATRGDELLIAQQTAANSPQKAEVLTYDTRIGTNDELITLLSAAKVNARLDELSEQLKKENNLCGLEKPEFIDKLSDYYLKYSHAAPFAGGTEHVLNVVVKKIGERAGYEIEPAAALHLREATDSILAAGLGSDKSRLVAVFGSVTKEAPGIGPEALRNPAQSRVPLEVTPAMKKTQTEEDMAQAGSKLAGRVGGQEGERFKAGMRALIAGDVTPDHINVVRTTALKYNSKDLENETGRLTKGAAFLDDYRRQQQQQGRQHDAANVQPRRERIAPSEITR